MNKLLTPLLLLYSSSVSAIRLQESGIFDKAIEKMGEKERAETAFVIEHQKNIVKA